MELSEDVRRIFGYLDTQQDEFIRRLGEAVAIPSVSQQKEYRPETIRVVDHFKSVRFKLLTTACVPF